MTTLTKNAVWISTGLMLAASIMSVAVLLSVLTYEAFLVVSYNLATFAETNFLNLTVAAVTSAWAAAGWAGLAGLCAAHVASLAQPTPRAARWTAAMLLVGVIACSPLLFVAVGKTAQHLAGYFSAYRARHEEDLGIHDFAVLFINAYACHAIARLTRTARRPSDADAR